MAIVVFTGFMAILWVVKFPSEGQRYTYRMLQTIQLKIILLFVWAELAALSSAKITLKFKYEI